jgi:anti-sigma regulatory factor (Ser/Thr protein kinase)
MELNARVESVAQARDAVGALCGLSDGQIADAQLVISELVTNAVLHAGLGPDDTIDLGILREGDLLRIEVDDHRHFSTRSEWTWPRRQRGGLGLRLVDQLSERWDADTGRVVAWLAL